MTPPTCCLAFGVFLIFSDFLQKYVSGIYGIIPSVCSIYLLENTAIIKKTIMSSKSNENGTVRRSFNEAIAGGAAGAFARTVVAPIDRIKLCSQLRGSIHTSSSTNFSPNDTAFQIFQKLVHREGLLSLWRGNFPTICAEAGNTALNFVFFDYYKQVGDHILDSIGNSHFREDGHDGGRNRRILRSFISGGLAGATTVTFMYPLGFMSYEDKACM